MSHWGISSGRKMEGFILIFQEMEWEENWKILAMIYPCIDIYIYIFFLRCQSYLKFFFKKRNENGYSYKTCIQMLTVSLFTIAKRQKQPKYPSTDEQNGHAIKYYPAMKRNPILTHAMTWINLEILMPIERRQVQNTCIVWSHLYEVKNRQNQTFLAVQWLKLCSSNAGDMGLIPSWGTIPSAQPKKRKIYI